MLKSPFLFLDCDRMLVLLVALGLLGCQNPKPLPTSPASRSVKTVEQNETLYEPISPISNPEGTLQDDTETNQALPLTLIQRIESICQSLEQEPYKTLVMDEKNEFCPLGKIHPELPFNVSQAFDGQGEPAVSFRLSRSLPGQRTEFVAITVKKYGLDSPNYINQFSESMKLVNLATVGDRFTFNINYQKISENMTNDIPEKIKVIQARVNTILDAPLADAETQYLVSLEYIDLGNNAYVIQEDWLQDPDLPSLEYQLNRQLSLVIPFEMETYVVDLIHVNQNNNGFHQASIDVSQMVLFDQTKQRYQLFQGMQ